MYLILVFSFVFIAISSLFLLKDRKKKDRTATKKLQINIMMLLLISVCVLLILNPPDRKLQLTAQSYEKLCSVSFEKYVTDKTDIDSKVLYEDTLSETIYCCVEQNSVEAFDEVKKRLNNGDFLLSEKLCGTYNVYDDVIVCVEPGTALSSWDDRMIFPDYTYTISIYRKTHIICLYVRSTFYNTDKTLEKAINQAIAEQSGEG